MPRWWRNLSKQERKDRLLSIRIIRDGPLKTKCWIWTGSIKHNGYAEIKIDGHGQMLHRFVYKEFVGPIPPGYQIRHHCDTKACFRPIHLEPGTSQDDADDRKRRGRAIGGAVFGDRNGSRTKPESRPRGAMHWTARTGESPKSRHLAKKGDLLKNVEWASAAPDNPHAARVEKPRSIKMKNGR